MTQAGDPGAVRVKSEALLLEHEGDIYAVPQDVINVFRTQLTSDTLHDRAGHQLEPQPREWRVVGWIPVEVEVPSARASKALFEVASIPWWPHGWHFPWGDGDDESRSRKERAQPDV